jgi:hypothetical protein
MTHMRRRFVDGELQRFHHPSNLAKRPPHRPPARSRHPHLAVHRSRRTPTPRRRRPRSPVVELHTGAYSEGRPGEFERLASAAALTKSLGLGCHASHGLTYDNVQLIAALAEVRELNLGRYVIGKAILHGPTQCATCAD